MPGPHSRFIEIFNLRPWAHSFLKAPRWFICTFSKAWWVISMCTSSENHWFNQEKHLGDRSIYLSTLLVHVFEREQTTQRTDLPWMTYMFANSIHKNKTTSPPPPSWKTLWSSFRGLEKGKPHVSQIPHLVFIQKLACWLGFSFFINFKTELLKQIYI